MNARHWFWLACVAVFASGCSKAPSSPIQKVEKASAVSYFKVDPATAGTISGAIRYIGPRPVRKAIDMSGDPACVEAHKTKPYDESLLVNPNGAVWRTCLCISRAAWRANRSKRLRRPRRWTNAVAGSPRGFSGSKPVSRCKSQTPIR